jgi:predicted NBD/HSP70 family sugar kinase
VAAASYAYGGIEAGGTKFVGVVGEAPQTVQTSTSIPTTTPTATLAHVIAAYDLFVAGVVPGPADNH